MAAKTRARPSWLKRSESVGYTHVELVFFFFVRSPWRWKGEKDCKQPPYAVSAGVSRLVMARTEVLGFY